MHATVLLQDASIYMYMYKLNISAVILYLLCNCSSSEDELWICKPTGANQGKGIFLVKSLKQVKDKLAADEAHCPTTRHPTQRIIQR